LEEENIQRFMRELIRSTMKELSSKFSSQSRKPRLEEKSKFCRLLKEESILST